MIAIKAVFSVPNLAWMVIFGGYIQEIRDRRFWSSKADLKYDLKMCGLKLDSGNKVILAGETCPHCGAGLPTDPKNMTCTACGTTAESG